MLYKITKERLEHLEECERLCVKRKVEGMVELPPSVLREKATFAEELGYRDHANTLRDAADTIERLLVRNQCEEISNLAGRTEPGRR